VWHLLAGLTLTIGGTAIAVDSECPAGMVLIAGTGRLGMKGQPYGVVHTAHLAKVEAPESGCPAAIASTPDASACWVQTDLVDPVVPVHDVSLQAYCIEAFPLPGKGYTYAKDGMSVWDVHELDRLLKSGRYGRRRLCTTSEFQAAVAGLKSNRRFVFGDEVLPGGCGGSNIGAVEGCINPETGVAEYAAVHSHWTVADSTFVAHACSTPPCLGAGNRPLKAGAYVVAGGTGRVQTRQAPLTPHTWHDHGDATVDACGFQGWDDQPVICADPGPDSGAASKAWAEFLSDVRRTDSIRSAISGALGGAICPE
jgi:hypothetical protein